MPDLAHLQLDKDVSTPPPERRGLRGPVLAILIACAIGALAYFAVTRYFRPATGSVRLQTEEAVVPRPGAAPGAVPGANIDLAPLDQTDALVRELVSRLSSHPKVAAWLATDNLIRNFTVSVVNISGGQSPVKHLQRLAPGAPFRATTSGSSSYVDPGSYSRYDDYAAAVAALDARGAAHLYATLEPRIEDAARELGQRQGEDFTVTLERAIVELLRTPVVEGSVAVVSSPVYWKYADPRLESLSGAQRQLLRMGPRNVQLIQAKLRELAPHLGIAAEKLPPPTVIRFPDAR